VKNPSRRFRESKPNKLAVVFVTVAVALAISSGDATAQRRVTVAFVAPTLSQTIPWIAKEAGILAKHGIDANVILLTGSPRAVQTLLAGDIEYTIAGGQSAIRARMHGADPVVLASSGNFSSQRVLLRPESTLQRLQYLKGKTVGVTQYGSGGDSFLRAALRRIGLRPDADVTILQMGGTLQLASSLLAGRVDAGVSGDPSVLLIHQGKMKQLPGASAKEMKILSSAHHSSRPVVTSTASAAALCNSCAPMWKVCTISKPTKKVRYARCRNSCASDGAGDCASLRRPARWDRSPTGSQ
jgi:ABC-type phosphate/phosphonate transport system substrate-binding protein